jgi:hypothetical protein
MNASKQHRSSALSPFVIAVCHFFISFAVALIVFYEAWGSGLSDSFQSDSAVTRGLTCFLVILQAPVAFIQWVVIKNSPQTHTGLGLQFLILLAAVWSATFGWLLATSYRKVRTSEN